MCKYIILAVLLTACGKEGPQGMAGANGTNGTNGVDASSVVPIQLCPGFVPTYPNVFPEYALCIDHQLYGVYSANGGFMALLPPGVYSSNGIGATCNLTVKANCVVVM